MKNVEQSQTHREARNGCHDRLDSTKTNHTCNRVTEIAMREARASRSAWQAFMQDLLDEEHYQ